MINKGYEKDKNTDKDHEFKKSSQLGIKQSPSVRFSFGQKETDRSADEHH